MEDQRPVLVGVDGSPGAHVAAQYAAAVAERLGAPVRLLHVLVDLAPVAPMRPMLPGDLEGTGHALLSEAAESVRREHPDVEVESVLVHAPRIRSLVEAGKEARLIVLGHQRRPPVDRLLVGSTVPGVAASATCPVVAVPARWSPPPRPGRVVVGVKDPGGSRPLLRRAVDEATLRGTGLLAVHTWELPGEYADLAAAAVDAAAWEERARHAIEETLALLLRSRPAVDTEVRVVHGQAARLLEQSTQDAGLLVLARRRHAFPSGHLGGTARALLRHAACPVEIVSPDD